MNDKIKEILDSLKDSQYIPSDDNRTYKLLDRDDTRHLLNYITNLQQENFNLRENILIHKMSFKSDDKSLEHLINMPSYEELDNRYKNSCEEYQKLVEELIEENERLKENNQAMQEEMARVWEENERLKETIKHYEDTTTFGDYVKEVNLLIDYKSRCEKASDKIQYIIDYGFDYDGFNTVESLKGLIDMLVDYARESKNILQNGSEKDE